MMTKMRHHYNALSPVGQVHYAAKGLVWAYVVVAILFAILLFAVTGCRTVDKKTGELTWIGRRVAVLAPIIAPVGKTNITATATNSTPSAPSTTNSVPPGGSVPAPEPEKPATGTPDAIPAGWERVQTAGDGFEAAYRKPDGVVVFADGTRAKWNEVRKRWSRDPAKDNADLYPPPWKGVVPVGAGMYQTTAACDDGLAYSSGFVPNTRYWLKIGGVWVEQAVAPPPKTF